MKLPDSHAGARNRVAASSAPLSAAIICRIWQKLLFGRRSGIFSMVKAKGFLRHPRVLAKRANRNGTRLASPQPRRFCKPQPTTLQDLRSPTRSHSTWSSTPASSRQSSTTLTIVEPHGTRLSSSTIISRKRVNISYAAPSHHSAVSHRPRCLTAR